MRDLAYRIAFSVTKVEKIQRLTLLDFMETLSTDSVAAAQIDHLLVTPCDANLGVKELIIEILARLGPQIDTRGAPKHVHILTVHPCECFDQLTTTETTGFSPHYRELSLLNLTNYKKERRTHF